MAAKTESARCFFRGGLKSCAYFILVWRNGQEGFEDPYHLYENRRIWAFT